MRRLWTLTLIVLLADAACMLLAGWSVSWSSLAAPAGAAAVLLPLGVPRYRADPRIHATATAAALLIAFQAVGAAFSYLAISTDAPLLDGAFAAADRALGLDWLAWNDWVRQRPALQAVLHHAYYSGLLQIAAVVVYLGGAARSAQLREFMRLLILATLITIIVSSIAPAAGAWKYYGLGASFDLGSMSHFELLRSGAMREIQLGAAQGLISMPSLHAVMAVLLAYAMRGTLLQWPMIVLNAAMLVSTPLEGGHYFVDVAAGIGLALALIAWLRRDRRG